MTLTKNKKRAHKSVSRRTNSQRRHVPLHRRLQDQDLRQKWNKHLSVIQNFAKLDTSIVTNKLRGHEYVDTAKKLSEPHARIMSKLILSHGDDIGKMAMDSKVNRWQWTPGQLRRKLLLYKQGFIAPPLGTTGPMVNKLRRQGSSKVLQKPQQNDDTNA